MALRFDLRPFEKLLIGGAVLTNADSKATFIIDGDVPVLRGKDEIHAGVAETSAEKLYLCIQNIFLAREGGRNTPDFPSLEATVRAEHPEWDSALDSVRAFVDNREYYKALRTLKPLLDANLFSSKREPGLSYRPRSD